MADEIRAAKAGLHELERHLAAEGRIFGQVNFSHPAFAEERQNLVFREQLPDLQRAALFCQ